MRLMKRVAATGFAALFVVGVLVVLHQFVHAVHGRSSGPSRIRAKLPPLISEAGSQKRSAASASPQPWTWNEPDDTRRIVLTGDFDSEPSSESWARTCLQAGGTKPVGDQIQTVPRPLAAPPNAVPLPPAADDWPPSSGPSRQELPSRESSQQNPRQPTSPGRRIIDKELPNSSAEERDLWHETMKDVPANDLRELLRLRAQFGRLSPPLGDSRRSAGQPLFAPGSAGIEGAPNYGQPREGAAPTSADPDPSHLLSETMANIAKARKVILNNIANARTNGYKRRMIAFESAVDRPMTPSTDGSLHFTFGASVDAGARLAPLVADMAVGKLVSTNRPLDLAIDGQGFFHVVDKQQKRDGYTRRGRFTTDGAGQLVLAAAGSEWVLQPPITVPADTVRVEIAGDGQVRGWDARKNSLVPIGTIRTVCFEGSSALAATDGTIFAPAVTIVPEAQTPGANGHGFLRQGCLEDSNVDLRQEVEELARLAEQAQVLEQAARLPQPGGSNGFHIPADAASLPTGTAIPPAR
jgi:flagellar basal-body rod protein FlgG